MSSGAIMGIAVAAVYKKTEKTSAIRDIIPILGTKSYVPGITLIFQTPSSTFLKN